MYLPKYWLLPLLVASLTFSAVSQEKSDDADKDISSPSPDGRYAFREKAGDEEDERSLDLVDPKSSKFLQQIDDSVRYGWDVLWAPNSRRFAETARFGHAMQEIIVFVRHRSQFRKVHLPEIEAKIPTRLKLHKSFPHIANLNYAEAKKWRKDGSLEVEVTTMLDGTADGSVTAVRQVLLGFSKTGKARIVKSTIKYSTESN